MSVEGPVKAPSENNHLNLAFKMRDSSRERQESNIQSKRKTCTKAGRRAGVGAIVKQPKVQFGRTCVDLVGKFVYGNN